MIVRWMIALLGASIAFAASAADGCHLEKYGELPVTMRGTQPTIAGAINGQEAIFIADSGAFFSVLTPSAVQKYQLKLSPLPEQLRVGGVGGTDYGAHLTVVKDFAIKGLIGGNVVHNVDFVVMSTSLSGTPVAGVIGQNLLGGADTEYDFANGAIRLFRSKGCEKNLLAYWHGTADVAIVEIEGRTRLNSHIIGSGVVNGKKIRIVFDTGAARSILTLKAAKRAGIEPDDDGASFAGVSGGMGKKSVETSTARFDVLDIGGEQIKNARLMIGDLQVAGNADMLLGSDFFLSHRVYLAGKQDKLFITYNGGPVFDLGSRGKAPVTAKTDSPAPDPETKSEAPPNEAKQNADELRRRGAASAGRRDFESAIADFDAAIKLDPNDAENFYQRGSAHLQNRQPRLALDDFDAALKIKPEHIGALMERGALRLGMRNEVGARSDFDAVAQFVPTDTALALRIAQIYVQSRRFDEGIARLDQWIAANPKDPQIASALEGRCWSRAQAGKDLDAALADCTASMKAGPRNSEKLGARGLVYLRRGDWPKAIEDLGDSLKLQPKNPMVLYALGIAEIKKGAKAEGEKHQQSALAISATMAETFKRMGLTD